MATVAPFIIANVGNLTHLYKRVNNEKRKEKSSAFNDWKIEEKAFEADNGHARERSQSIVSARQENTQK